jgi:NitT/TauT family transport system ATP-binding protein
MKQRVAIARALAMQPRVLLMDEPFAALDALTRRKMQEELLALWDEVRFTLVFVTHSIEEALVVGNRIGMLSPHPGRVRAEINSHEFDLQAKAATPSRPRPAYSRPAVRRACFRRCRQHCQPGETAPRKIA